MTKGSVGYYKRLARYLRKGHRGDGPDDEPGAAPGGSEIPMTTPNAFTSWHGQAARYFGLVGKPIKNTDFERLCQGLHPATEEKLVQNAKSTERCPGWDHTFSAPKSVSVAWAAASESFQYLIELAFDASVKDALTKLRVRPTLFRESARPVLIDVSKTSRSVSAYGGIM